MNKNMFGIIPTTVYKINLNFLHDILDVRRYKIGFER
jgi:hypothetical protein